MRDRSVTYKTLRENLKERDYLESPSGWDCTVTTNFKEIGWRGVDWIDLAQDRDKWRVRINMVTKLGFRKIRKFLDYRTSYFFPTKNPP
jgi:hypothetical protein